MIPTTVSHIGRYEAYAVSEPAKSDIANRIRNLVRGLSPSGRFPGPNPCSLERSNLASLTPGNYWLCEKTDGTRVLLAFLTYEGVKAAFVVTRAWNVYAVGIRCCPKVLFQGSLFDGELVHRRGQWVWLGFDAMMVAGVPVYELCLSERLRCATRSLSAYQPHPKDSLHLEMKPYFKTFVEYETYLQNVSHPIDGTILTPETMPVICGRHTSLFKIKDGDKHTIDFEFQPPDVLKVYDPATKRSVPVGVLDQHGYDGQAGTILEAALSDACRCPPAFRLVTVRHDKHTSNDMLTYQKTLLNIKENLRLDDVKAAFNAEK